MNSGLDVFDNTIQKTTEILKQIESDLDWENRRNQSYLALRSVLHALRDRLPVEEAVHLSAQFPLLVKGIFFDGWRPIDVPIKMSRAEFVQKVAEEFRFDVAGGIEKVIFSVLNAVFDSLDPSEKIKIEENLPDDIVGLFY